MCVPFRQLARGGVLVWMGVAGQTLTLEATVWHNWDEAAPHLAAFLRNQASHPFLNPDWIAGYWQSSRREGERPLFIGVYRGLALVAVTAFRFRPWGPIGTASFLTEGRADLNGIAGEQSTEAFSAIWDALRRQAGIGAVRFSDVRADSAFAAYLRTCSPAVETNLYPCPYLDLSPEAGTGSASHRKFQTRIPNYARRLGALGEVSFQVLDFDADRTSALAALPALFALHDMRHAGRRNSWKNGGNRAFLRHYLETAERTNFLAFVTLLDGHPVAFDLGLRADERFILYIPAFHPSFERFRLGHVNRHFSFDACRRMGILHYDFSRGDSFAKRVWANGAEDNLEFCLPLGKDALSLTVAKMLGARQTLKSTLRRKAWPGRLADWLESRRASWDRVAPKSNALLRFAGERDLQYNMLAGCAEAHLTPIVEAVFALPRTSTLRAAWKGPQTLMIFGAGHEFALVAGMNSEQPPAPSPVTVPVQQ